MGSLHRIVLLVMLIHQACAFNFTAYYYPELPFALGDITIPQECIDEFNTLLVESKETLALMIDASAKLPPGVLTGRKRIMGDYEECLAIQHGDILGKYCADSLPIGGESGQMLFSICIPSGCNIKFDGLLEKLFNNICHTREVYELEAQDYTVSAIFGTILFFIVVSTMYDVYVDSNKKPRPHPILTAFSALSNMRTFMRINRKPDQLSALNGIRFISMVWIIGGHRYVMMQLYPLINPKFMEDVRREWYSFSLAGGRIGVDTFFFLGALLFSYLLFKNLEKNAIKFYQLPLIYLQRILRILPAVIPLYLIHISVITKLASGPLWPAFFNNLKGFCIDHWWSFFLFVQNYVNYDEMCVMPTWYLAADMQLFLVAPFLVFPMQYLTLKGRKRHAYIFGCVMVVIFAIIPYIPDLINENPNEYVTHQRLATYMIGLVFGIVMVDVKRSVITLSKIIVIVGWIIAISTMLAILIVIAKMDVEYVIGSKEIVAMNMVTRPLWCIGLCWVIFACNTGNGGFINWFLSLPYFDYGAKISYAMYIVHNSIIMMSNMFVRTEVFVNDYVTTYLFCGDFIFTSVVGFIWHLAFEAPAVIFVQLLFGAAKKVPDRKNAA